MLAGRIASTQLLAAIGTFESPGTDAGPITAPLHLAALPDFKDEIRGRGDINAASRLDLEPEGSA